MVRKTTAKRRPKRAVKKVVKKAVRKNQAKGNKMPNKRKLISVEFTKPWTKYNRGEIAGFTEEIADQLLVSGIAVLVERNSKRGRKTLNEGSET